MGENRGSIAFFTTYRPPVALDIYSCPLPPKSAQEELKMSDGESYNFNGHSIPPAALKIILKRPKLVSEGIKDADVDNGSVSGMVFVSERDNLETLQIALQIKSSSSSDVTTKVFSFEEVYNLSDGVRMEDRPCIAGENLVYISTKEPADCRRQPWTAVYKTNLKSGKTERLTPSMQADLSPSVSPSGKRIAVASYQKNDDWAGKDQYLNTSIYVMNVEKPFNRRMVVENGGWPTWGSECVLFFHRKIAEFWAVLRVEFSDTFTSRSTRVTPYKSNAMTPVAIDAFTVAVAMISDLGIDRTKLGTAKYYRHIMVFDSNNEQPAINITQVTKPLEDHFNPFVVMDLGKNTKRIGYHRVNTDLINEVGENIKRQLSKIECPVPDVGLFRLSGAISTFSKDSRKVAFVDNEFKSVWVADGQGLHMVFKTEEQKTEKIFSPVWNQNKDILYVCIGPGFSADQQLGIYRIPNASKGRQRAQPLTDGFNNAFPSTNPEGTKLVFRSTRGHPQAKFKNLYIMEDEEEGDYGEGCISRLTNGDWIDTHCQWSPSGEWIVFSSNREKPRGAPRKDKDLDEGFFAVYLVNPMDPYVVVRVFGSGDDCSGHVIYPFFSPDGRTIVATADLAGISVDPISLPFVEHTVWRAYGEIFSVEIHDNIEKNENVKDFKRITNNRYGNFLAAWTETGDPYAAWNQQSTENTFHRAPYPHLLVDLKVTFPSPNAVVFLFCNIF